MIKICHMTSVHNVYDTRIFLKECQSLNKAGYDVTLIAPYDRDEIINNIKILGIRKPNNRIYRMLNTANMVYKRAMDCNADIYHFHDSELIPVGLKLKKNGKKVIYDAHEDVPRDILYKEWIPSILRPIISAIMEKIEGYAAKKFDSIVVPTPFIGNRFKKFNSNVSEVKNYPFIQDDVIPERWKNKERCICFISSSFIKVRAINEIVTAMNNTDARLLLAGLLDNEIDEELKKVPGYDKVDYLGYVNRADVLDIMRKSIAGVSLYYPTSTNINAIPTKMFEYMMAGLPVISSNLPYESQIISENQCGICVDPFSPDQMTEAINYLLNNPKEAEAMGLNGKKAVEHRYNWSTEEAVLLNTYKKIINQGDL